MPLYMSILGLVTYRRLCPECEIRGLEASELLNEGTKVVWVKEGGEGAISTANTLSLLILSRQVGIREHGGWRENLWVEAHPLN